MRGTMNKWFTFGGGVGLSIAGSLLAVGVLMPHFQGFSLETMEEKIEKTIETYLEKNPAAIKKTLEKALYKEAQAAQHKQKEAIHHAFQEIRKDPSAPVIGNKQGTKEVILFTDPLCGYCRHLYNVLSQVIQEDPHLKVFVQDYPLIGGKASMKIVETALAVANQGKYQEFMNQVYAHKGGIGEGDLKTITENLSCDQSQLKKDMENPGLQERIQASIRLGNGLKIQGTPALVYKDQMHVGAMDLKAMRELFQDSGGNGSGKSAKP